MGNISSAAALLSSRDSDVARNEHDDLLSWLWANAETVVPGLYLPTEEWKKDAVAAYAQSYQCFFDEVRKIIKRTGPNEELELALAACIERVGDVESKHIPGELCLARLTSKTFEEAIVQVKHGQRGESRADIVGFVDMTCEVSVPDELAQKNNLLASLPFGSLEGFDVGEETVDSARILTELGEVADPDARNWVIRTATRKAWFDVRAKLPALGQLIRELKHLATHADENTDIFVVVASLPPQHVSILEHEGFRVVQRNSFF